MNTRHRSRALSRRGSGEGCGGEGEIDEASDGCRGRKIKRYSAEGKSQGYFETFDHRTLTADAWQARRDAAVAPVRDALIAEITNAWRGNK